MAHFKDNQERVWSLQFDMLAVQRIERELQIQILDFQQGFLRVIGSPASLISVLWILCRPNEQGLSPEAFARAFDDVVLDGAARSLLDAYVDFFRSPSRRALLEALRRRVHELEATREETLSAMVAAIGTTPGGSPP